jgi:hypothetical protein
MKTLGFDVGAVAETAITETGETVRLGKQIGLAEFAITFMGTPSNIIVLAGMLTAGYIVHKSKLPVHWPIGGVIQNILALVIVLAGIVYAAWVLE